jgi:acyl-CoA thioesterase-1
MLRIFFFTLSWFFLSQKSFAKEIVFLGDSLTEGYGVAQEAAFPQLIQKKIQADKLDWKVISSGSSGSTSASTLSRLKWVTKNKPDWVLILMGSNDGLRGLKIEETEKNLGEALKWANENKVNVILGQLYVPPNYGKDYFKKFSELFPKLAKEYHVKLAPFLLDKVAGIPSLNQVDGIHPNEKGHAIVADTIYNYLKKEIFKP